MSKVFFWADLHFCHRNVLRHQAATRPFSDIKKMNEAYIDAWNSNVNNSDRIYILGDMFFTNDRIAMQRIIERLNGQKFLVIGNHDKKKTLDLDGFVWKKDLVKISVYNQEIVLCHYAMRVWNKKHYGSWHLYGHSHGNLLEDDSLSFDVGVDVFPEPVSFEEVQAKIEQKKKTLESINNVSSM